MTSEEVYHYGIVFKEWAQCAFWISGAACLVAAAYRFLFA